MPRFPSRATATATTATALATALAERIESLGWANELAGDSGLGTGANAWRPSGSELDAALPVGVPRGQVTEWAGPRSAGKTAMLREIVRSVREAGAGAAYVDGTGTLAPAPWAETKGPPFWVVRPPGPVEVLAAAEELLRSGAFGLVVAEGADWLRTSVIRLQRLSQEAGSALVAVVDRVGRVPMAGLRVEVRADLDSALSLYTRNTLAKPHLFRCRIRIRGCGSPRKVAYVQELPYRLPEDSGFPDRRTPAV